MLGVVMKWQQENAMRGDGSNIIYKIRMQLASTPTLIIKRDILIVQIPIPFLSFLGAFKSLFSISSHTILPFFDYASTPTPCPTKGHARTNQVRTSFISSHVTRWTKDIITVLVWKTLMWPLPPMVIKVSTTSNRHIIRHV